MITERAVSGKGSYRAGYDLKKACRQDKQDKQHTELEGIGPDGGVAGNEMTACPSIAGGQ